MQPICRFRIVLPRRPDRAQFYEFMNNDEWQHELYELVARIEQCQHTKQEIDDVYNKLCTIILSEMDRCGQYKENEMKGIGL